MEQAFAEVFKLNSYVLLVHILTKQGFSVFGNIIF